MDRFDRILALHRILSGRRTGIGLADLVDRLSVSEPTVKRAIRTLRETLGAPLEYDRGRGGYFYGRNEADGPFELPGLWFTSDELRALFTLQHVLGQLQPGLLADEVAPLARRIDAMMAHHGVGLSEAGRRIRVLPQAARQTGPCFPAITTALTTRRKVSMTYTSRSSGGRTDRVVSPQRIVLYRDNWYLDAACHLRKDLRSFAVDRIERAQVVNEPAEEVEDAVLDRWFADAYGIFSGPASRTAVLRFAPHRARWVADESWHPRQKARWLQDGSFELTIPYGRPEELILDILRLGSDVEVVDPPELRSEVCRRLRAALERYENPAERITD